MTPDQKSKIQDFLKNHNLCVVSTFGLDGFPNSAVVAFSETEDLKLVFSTWNQTRKFRNLEQNPKVTFTIGWSFEEFSTMQYQGIARLLSSDEVDKYREIHVTKNEYSKKFAYKEDNVFYLVEPTYIKYSNLKANPDEVFELNF